MFTDRFGTVIYCAADGEESQFRDGYKLDVHYLHTCRPRLLSVQFLLRIKLSGVVEQCDGSETVVLQTQYGESRFPRSRGDLPGLSVQWKDERTELAERLQSLIFQFPQEVRPGLTDRKCIWVRPGEMAFVHFVVYPREFSANESIWDLVQQAKVVLSTELLAEIQPA